MKSTNNHNIILKSSVGDHNPTEDKDPKSENKSPINMIQAKPTISPKQMSKPQEIQKVISQGDSSIQTLDQQATNQVKEEINNLQTSQRSESIKVRYDVKSSQKNFNKDLKMVKSNQRKQSFSQKAMPMFKHSKVQIQQIRGDTKRQIVNIGGEKTQKSTQINLSLGQSKDLLMNLEEYEDPSRDSEIELLRQFADLKPSIPNMSQGSDTPQNTNLRSNPATMYNRAGISTGDGYRPNRKDLMVNEYGQGVASHHFKVKKNQTKQKAHLNAHLKSADRGSRNKQLPNRNIPLYSSQNFHTNKKTRNFDQGIGVANSKNFQTEEFNPYLSPYKLEESSQNNIFLENNSMNNSLQRRATSYKDQQQFRITTHDTFNAMSQRSYGGLNPKKSQSNGLFERETQSSKTANRALNAANVQLEQQRKQIEYLLSMNQNLMANQRESSGERPSAQLVNINNLINQSTTSLQPGMYSLFVNQFQSDSQENEMPKQIPVKKLSVSQFFNKRNTEQTLINQISDSNRQTEIRIENVDTSHSNRQRSDKAVTQYVDDGRESMLASTLESGQVPNNNQIGERLLHHERKVSQSMQDLKILKTDSPKIQSNAVNEGIKKMSESKVVNHETQDDSILKDEEVAPNTNIYGVQRSLYEELQERISKLESENQMLRTNNSVSKDFAQTQKLIDKVALVTDDSCQMNHLQKQWAGSEQIRKVQTGKNQALKQNYEIMMLRKEMKKKKEVFEDLELEMEKESLERYKAKHQQKDFERVNAFKEIEQIIDQVSTCLKIPDLKVIARQLNRFSQSQADHKLKQADLDYKQLSDQFVTLQQQNQENLKQIETLEEKIKFEQESLERFLNKTGKSQIIEDIQIYEQLAPIRYVKNLNKDGEPEKVEGPNGTQDDEKEPLQNYSGLLKELQAIQNLFSMRIGQEFNTQINQIQDDEKAAQTLEEMMTEFQEKFQNVQSDTARKVINRCIRKPVELVEQGCQAEGDDIFKAERLQLETQFREKQHAYMEIKMENQMIQKSLEQLKKEKMEQGYELTSKNNMLAQERDEKRDLLSEKTHLEKQVERINDIVKNKDVANEKMRAKIQDQDQVINNWKGKYESCYYSWEQNKEDLEQMESKWDEVQAEIGKKQSRVNILIKEKAKLQSKITKIQTNLDKGMKRFTKRIKKVKSQRDVLHQDKDDDGSSSVFTEESYYEYPKAEISEVGSKKKSVQGIASALTDKEYLKVVSALGIVEKQIIKKGATISEEEARAQILAWFDSEPERANIDEDKKEEMLSVIAHELWAKIKSKTSSHSNLPNTLQSDAPAIINQSSESSQQTTPKMQSKLMSKMASIQHIKENPSLSRHSLLNMDNLEQKKQSTRIKEDISTLNASTQRLATYENSASIDDHKNANQSESQKIGFQNQQINMLVDANYGNFKTNITNIPDGEDEETSRSIQKKIAVLQRENEIPEPQKLKMTQSMQVQTEITSQKFKIMSKSDFYSFATQTEEAYFPFDAQTQAAINNVLGRKIHHSADRFQSVQSAYNQTCQEDTYFYHPPGQQIPQKNKVIKKMYKPKVSMITKTILNEQTIQVPESSVNIVKESSYRQSTEFEKNLVHMNDLELKLDSDATNTINLENKSNSHDPTMLYQNTKSIQQYSPRFGAMKSGSKLTFNRRNDSSMASERPVLKPTLNQNQDISQTINQSFDTYKMNEQALSHLVFAKKHVLPIKLCSDQKQYLQSSVVFRGNLQQNDHMHKDFKSSLQNTANKRDHTIEQVDCESKTVENNKESLDEPEMLEASNQDGEEIYKVLVIQNSHDLAKSMFNETQVMTKTKQTGFGSGGSESQRDQKSHRKKSKE